MTPVQSSITGDHLLSGDVRDTLLEGMTDEKNAVNHYANAYDPKSTYNSSSTRKIQKHILLSRRLFI